MLQLFRCSLSLIPFSPFFVVICALFLLLVSQECCPWQKGVNDWQDRKGISREDGQEEKNEMEGGEGREGMPVNHS